MEPFNAFSLLPDEYKWPHAWLTTPQELRDGSSRLRRKLWRPLRRSSGLSWRHWQHLQAANVKRAHCCIHTINLSPLTREMLLFLPTLFSCRSLICFWSGGAAVAFRKWKMLIESGAHAKDDPLLIIPRCRQKHCTHLTTVPFFSFWNFWNPGKKKKLQLSKFLLSS